MKRARFTGRSDFHRELKSRVADYFETTGLPRTGTGHMFLKTAVALSGLLGCYVWLVFYAEAVWTVAIDRAHAPRTAHK